jgi:hypothetical protein
MRIEKRSMGWIQKPTAYKYSQQLNARRRASAQLHLRDQSLLAGSIFAAKDAMSQGMVEIAFKAVITRVQGSSEVKIGGGPTQIGTPRSLLAPGGAYSGASSGSLVLDTTA